MNEVFDTDVAILGAGPAGSTLALLLARRGIDCTLIDRDTFPRDKLCGEFLSYDALPVLERMSLLDSIDQAGATRIGSCRIVGARAFAFDFPDQARGISRLTLDRLLFDAAVAAGARSFAGHTAASLESQGDRTRVILQDSQRREASIRARCVIGAWGRWGRLDRQLDRPFASDRTHRHFGFKRHYRQAGQDVSRIDLISFDRGYLGVLGIEGGRINVCGLVHESRLAGLKGGWPAFIETISREVEPLRRLFTEHEPAQQEFLSSEPVIFSARQPVHERVLMIGDAAGLIDPLAGNGMAMGIQSAVLAAPFVFGLLAGQSSAPSEYALAYESFFLPRIRWSRRVALLLSRPRLLGAATSLVRSPSIGRFLLQRTRADRERLEQVMGRWFV